MGVKGCLTSYSNKFQKFSSIRLSLDAATGQDNVAAGSAGMSWLAKMW